MRSFQRDLALDRLALFREVDRTKSPFAQQVAELIPAEVAAHARRLQLIAKRPGAGDGALGPSRGRRPEKLPGGVMRPQELQDLRQQGAVFAAHAAHKRFAFSISPIKGVEEDRLGVVPLGRV